MGQEEHAVDEPIEQAAEETEDVASEGSSPGEDLASIEARALLWVAAVVGIFVAAAPQTVFPVCEYLGLFRTGPSGEQLFMRCHQTATIAVWIGAAVAAMGVGGAIWGTRRAALFTGSALLLAGFVCAILSLVIAPVCVSASMPCVTGTQPALVVSGVLLMVLGAAAFVLGMRRSA